MPLSHFILFQYYLNLMQNSQQISEQFLNSIKVIDDVPCYVRINESKFIVIAIHQHLGLIENFTQMVNTFVQNYASIIIPDLFCNIQVQNIDEDDQFACLRHLSLSEAHLILKKCILYAYKKNKIIILLGFSVGAALGLKLIENYNQVSLGMFFYGYPRGKCLEPKNINCPVVIFHAQKDRVKHLSDKEQLKEILEAVQKQPNIKIQNVSSSHGFMNHQHPNFDEQSLKYCRKKLHQYLLQIEKNPKGAQQKVQLEKSIKKEEQGGCSTY